MLIVLEHGASLPILSLLIQETSRLFTEPVAGIEAIPAEDNARYFQVAVAGPKDVSVQIVGGVVISFFLIIVLSIF